MLFGLMLSYWINYAFYFHPGQIQWRFPIIFQAVFALYVLLITPFLPDTPRWLMLHESSPARGTEVLAKLRGKLEDDPIVQKEKSDILSVINIESEEEGSWKSLFMDGGCAANKRFFLAVGIQFMQQTSGKLICASIIVACLAKLFAYRYQHCHVLCPYAFPGQLGHVSGRGTISGLFPASVVYYRLISYGINATPPAENKDTRTNHHQWYMIDSVGRRRLYIIMALGMCIVLICEAITVAIGTTKSGIAAVFFVFAFEACFTWGELISHI